MFGLTLSCFRIGFVALYVKIYLAVDLIKTKKGQTQTAATKLEAQYCLKYHWMLSHERFPFSGNNGRSV